MRFFGISNSHNGLTTSEIAPYVYFFRRGDKRSAARDGDNGVSGISNNYNGFTTLENAPYVYFFCRGEGLRFFDFLKCMNTISGDF